MSVTRIAGLQITYQAQSESVPARLGAFRDLLPNFEWQLTSCDLNQNDMIR